MIVQKQFYENINSLLVALLTQPYNALYKYMKKYKKNKYQFFNRNRSRDAAVHNRRLCEIKKIEREKHFIDCFIIFFHHGGSTLKILRYSTAVAKLFKRDFPHIHMYRQTYEYMGMNAYVHITCEYCR